MEKPVRASSATAFTLVEVMVTICVLMVGIMVIVSSFSMNLRSSSATREELMANLVMESLVEEVVDHAYGDPPPDTWSNSRVSFPGVVEGLPVQSTFERNVSISKKSGNGSFFGQGDQSSDSDVVTLEVRWTQPSGQGSSGQDKVLSADLTVARKP
jgi:Tfp pilus assembly protein PilV